MRLTLTQRNAAPGAAIHQAAFEAPGGTLGRSIDNDLVLPDEPGGICRVQAVVRLNDDACYVYNLSGMSYVSLNDMPIRQGQELPLTAGDVLRVGPYALEAVIEGQESAAAPAPAEPAPPVVEPAVAAATAAGVMATDAATASATASNTAATGFEAPETPPADQAAPNPLETPSQPVEEDIFGDLFGPGTLPVGASPDMAAHPFDMASAQSRNAEDPLSHLPRGETHVAGEQRDPLELFQALHGGDDVFADQTPSTLPAHDPLAPLRTDPVDEVLRQKRDAAAEGAPARDHLRESGGFLRPAAPRKPSDPDKR